MGLDIKKNEKLNKVITVILVGILILIIVVPTRDSSSGDTQNNLSEEDGMTNGYDSYADYYENKLKEILEDSYGEGTMQVMVHLINENQTEGLYGSSENEVTVDGVLIVAAVDSEQAVSDITFAVCALFDLPAHKVAVMIKK